MSEAIFGKTITRSFIPWDGASNIDTPSQVPSIFLFASEPSFDSAANGTGAVDTTNYWIHSSVTAERSYTFEAIADPQSASASSFADYWEAINYKLETAGATQTLKRSFPIRRAGALDSTTGTSVQDIKDLWPEVSAYITDSELDRYLVIAEELLRSSLEGNGMKWGSLRQLNKIKYCIAFKAIVLFSAIQLTKPNGDKFAARIEYFTKELSALMESVNLPMDADGDGVAESETQVGRSYTIIER